MLNSMFSELEGSGGERRGGRFEAEDVYKFESEVPALVLVSNIKHGSLAPHTDVHHIPC